MAWISLRDTVWVESYSDAAPLKCANGSVIDINWRDRTVLVSFSHPDGEETMFYGFDDLYGEYDKRYNCFMIFDVAD